MQALMAFFDLDSLTLSHQLFWISALSDAAIALSYYVISWVIFYLIRKRKGLSYSWFFGMVGFFVAVRGTAHFLSLINILTPLHGLEGVFEAISVLLSLAAAIAVIWFIPKALRLPNAAQFQAEVEERKKAEEALRKRTHELKDNEEKFHSIYESSSDAIMLLTEKGFFDCNSSTLKMFGLTCKDEFIAMHPAELSPAFQPDGKASLGAANEKIAAAMLQGVNRFEWMHRRKNGEDFPALVSLTAFDFEGKRVLQASVRDITEHKRIETSLQLAKQNAEAANRAKSEFLANISHEIRTPMNAILGLTEWVLNSPLTPQQQNYLRKVHASSKSLLGILNDILDFSKIESGRLEIENVPFQIQKVLEEVTNLFDVSATEKGLALYVDIDKDLPLQVMGDPLHLTQVLNNLLDNALKFTDRGEIHLKVELTKITQDNLILRFAVRDTGIGLSKQQSEHLFQPFTQADGSMTRKYGGTGLGLVICQKLVGFMGGEIAVSGAPGQGCVVSFTVRVGRIKGHDVLPVLNQTLPATPSFDGAHVLLVEDNVTHFEVKALPDNPTGFDLSETLSRLGDDHELLGRLLQIFIDEQSNAVVQLDAYLKAGEWGQAAVFLHTLKGVAGNLGATSLAQAALKLEHEIKSGNERVSYSSFVSALKLTLAAFDQYIKQPTAQSMGLADIDKHDLTRLFNQLIPYLRNSEVIPFDLMQSLHQLADVDQLGVSLPELILQIDRFNHDGAIDCIEKIAAQLHLELFE